MSGQSYLIPNLAAGEWHESELVIRRSRFLTHITRADSPAMAREAIDVMRTRHADATHNCWAFNAGPPGSTAQIGANDDGEPHGTAGRPMLGMLLHSDVGCICCVVTRWFGGIKLGNLRLAFLVSNGGIGEILAVCLGFAGKGGHEVVKSLAHFLLLLP